MIRWLQSKILKWSIDAMRDDLERFVRSMQGASSSDLGDLIVLATILRLQFEKNGEFERSEGQLGSGTGGPNDPLLALGINRIIAQLQRNRQHEQAGAAMVWLHTVRATQNPELRLIGRQLWKELVRGQKSADAVRIEQGIRVGVLPPNLAEEVLFVPAGLEPEFE